jgi:hypothetical protein
VDTEFFRTAQGFAGELDDQASVVRLRHRNVPPLAAASAVDFNSSGTLD